MKRRGCLLLIVLIGACSGLSVYDARVRAPDLLARFRAELQKGLSERERERSFSRNDPYYADMITNPGLSKDEFVNRLRQVEGWDRLAFISPYGSGSEIASEAAGFNPWLQLRLRMTGGYWQDGLFKVLVIDNGRVVATLCFYYCCPSKAVIDREP